MARIYYLNYIDPISGFLRREQSRVHRDIEKRITELRAVGVKHITEGSFEQETSTPT